MFGKGIVEIKINFRIMVMKDEVYYQGLFVWFFDEELDDGDWVDLEQVLCIFFELCQQVG